MLIIRILLIVIWILSFCAGLFFSYKETKEENINKKIYYQNMANTQLIIMFLSCFTSIILNYIIRG